MADLGLSGSVQARSLLGSSSGPGVEDIGVEGIGFKSSPPSCSWVIRRPDIKTLHPLILDISIVVHYNISQLFDMRGWGLENLGDGIHKATLRPTVSVTLVISPNPGWNCKP